MGYREIPEDKILKFPATPGFRGWKRFFTHESTTHPAKMNLNLLRWILRTYTEPGEAVLDPMAGTGSTVVLAALEGRHGVAVEYEPTFCEMIKGNMELAEKNGARGRTACIQGDARELSQLLEESDVIVTSPPYGNRLSDVAVKDGDPARMGYRQAVDKILTSPPYEDSVPAYDQKWLEEHWDDESDSPKHKTMRFGKSMRGYPSREEGNIGSMKGETYLEAMLKVYRECHKVLKPGGVMALVTKNFIRDKAVVRLDLDTIKLCEAAGFRLSDRWYLKLTTRSFWKILYRRNYPDVPEVKYEDVLVFMKGVDILDKKV